MDLKQVREQLAAVEWRGGWSACSAAQGIALAAQLQKEVKPGHVLHGRGCTAVARHEVKDEVLFFVAGDESREGRLAVVRLTWQVPRVEGRFPWAQEFGSVGEWAAGMGS